LILHSSGIFSAAGGTQYGATPSIAMALVLARFSFHTKQQAIQDAQLFAEISEAHSHGFERVGWLQARIDHIFAVSLYVQAQSHSKLNPTEAYLCGFAGFFCLGNGSLGLLETEKTTRILPNVDHDREPRSQLNQLHFRTPQRRVVSCFSCSSFLAGGERVLILRRMTPFSKSNQPS